MSKLSKNTVVCDIGAGSIKIGFAGRLTPDEVIPTIFALPRQECVSSKNDKSDLLLGNEALLVRDRNKVSFCRPIDEYGIVKNWDALENLLRYGIERIGVKSSDCCHHKILLTRPFGMNYDDIQRLFDMMFERFGFGAVSIHEQAAMVLYSHGVETGIVVELGDGMGRIVPIYKGHAIPKLDKRMAVGGRSISKYLTKLLRLRGYHMDTKEELEMARQIKENSCYVALSIDIEERLAENTTILETCISCQDGSYISVGKERYHVAEALFEPKRLDSETSGIADLIFETIQEADIDCRVDLYKNIILSGGSSLLPGLRARLQHDLRNRYTRDILRGDPKRAPRTWKLQVHAPNGREVMVFEGAALFADLIAEDEKFWVSKSEYSAGYKLALLLGKCKIA